MLADHVVFPILLATDLDASRAFYRDVLGLPILTENDERVLFAGQITGVEGYTESTATGLMALSAGSRSFTRYGYGDLMREDKKRALGRIDKAPFYAVDVVPGDVSTYGGVVTDTVPFSARGGDDCCCCCCCC